MSSGHAMNALVISNISPVKRLCPDLSGIVLESLMDIDLINMNDCQVKSPTMATQDETQTARGSHPSQPI
ncbi:MAG: hypothetical protein IPO92_13350 [Saprospiraceae bacterium]|nr:hypothetical protein [Saprospiraceae bacterium]